jgi:hypothetical protein
MLMLEKSYLFLIVWASSGVNCEDLTITISISCACMAWRRAVRWMWSLSPTTHGDLLPLLSDLLPLHDEICCRSLFLLLGAVCCISRGWCVTLHCMMFCSHVLCYRSVGTCYFAVAIQILLAGLHMGRIDPRLVQRHCGGIVSDDNISAANFIKELTDLPEWTPLFSPDPSFLTQSEISDCVRYNIIYYTATTLWVKKKGPLYFCRYLGQILTDFQKFFDIELRSKYTWSNYYISQQTLNV